jgi:hypothetical protein
MVTHRRGFSPQQWSVGDLLRREGRRAPSLSPTAGSAAVGTALVCCTAVAVSLAAERDDAGRAIPAGPGPAPGATSSGSAVLAAPGAAAPDAPIGAPLPMPGGPDSPLVPAIPHRGGDGPVDGSDIAAATLDPGGRTDRDDAGPDDRGGRNGDTRATADVPRNTDEPDEPGGSDDSDDADNDIDADVRDDGDDSDDSDDSDDDSHDGDDPDEDTDRDGRDDRASDRSSDDTAGHAAARRPALAILVAACGDSGAQRIDAAAVLAALDELDGSDGRTRGR